MLGNYVQGGIDTNLCKCCAELLSPHRQLVLAHLAAWQKVGPDVSPAEFPQQNTTSSVVINFLI